MFLQAPNVARTHLFSFVYLLGNEAYAMAPINSAMRAWTSDTEGCIKFKKRSGEESSYVSFFRGTGQVPPFFAQHGRFHLDHAIIKFVSSYGQKIYTIGRETIACDQRPKPEEAPLESPGVYKQGQRIFVEKVRNVFVMGEALSI